MNISLFDFVGCFWRNLIHFVKANLLFFLFCLPILTIPASLTALNTVCADAAMGRSGEIWKTFLTTIKEKFGKSLAVGFIYTVVFCFSGVSIWFYSSLGTRSKAAIIPEGIVFALAMVTLASMPYSFVMIGKTDLSIKEILKNSLIMLILEPRTAIVSVLIIFFWIYIQTMLFLNIYAVILVIGATLVVYAGAYFAIYGLLIHVITDIA